MSLRDLLRKAARVWKYTRPLGVSWSGIYRRPEEVPVEGRGFADERWVEATRLGTLDVHRDLQSGASIPPFLTGEKTYLPLVAAIAGAEKGRVCILDFGGGLGIGALFVTAAMQQEIDVDYHIVEMPAIVAARDSVPRLERVHFHTELPRDVRPDVVFVSSALQYVDDYAKTLAELCAYGARFLLFVSLAAGDVPTYITAQKNLRGFVSPYWILNLGEMLRIVESHGYRLLFKSLCDHEHDQSNFPPEYRFGRPCNLLFSRLP